MKNTIKELLAERTTTVILNEIIERVTRRRDETLNSKIKFRCWDESKKEMIYGIERSKKFEYYLKNYHCMQYIGTKDVHGTEIYEGDIVAWRWDEKRHHYFRIEDMFTLIRGKIKNAISHIEFPSVIEVVGDNYEHPEILDNI